MRHSGTEYGYLISGELELNLGFDKYVLAAGDSVCFESTKPHGYRNDGEVPAVGVVRGRTEPINSDDGVRASDSRAAVRASARLLDERASRHAATGK